METNAYYFSRLSPIGGIETFLYQLAKSNKDKGITFYYRSADIKQLKRLSKYCTCLQYTEGVKIRCEKFFCNFNLDPLINGDVEAKEKGNTQKESGLEKTGYLLFFRSLSDLIGHLILLAQLCHKTSNKPINKGHSSPYEGTITQKLNHITIPSAIWNRWGG